MIYSIVYEAIIANCFIAPNLSATPARRSGGHAKARQHVSGYHEVQNQKDNQVNQVHCAMECDRRDLICLCLQLHTLP